MPIADHLPVIDNRRYDDIVAEIRARIARYTPEWTPVWTDVNDSDPGITMVQVFAWLADMLLYRMQRVPELNYLKFLQLLGIELRPATPATAEITFPVMDTWTEPYVIVRPRTQVSAPAAGVEGAGGETPVVFETDRPLVALTARLVEVQLFDGYEHRRVTEANAEARQGFEPFGATAAPDTEMLLGFAYPANYPTPDRFPQTVLDLAVWSAQPGRGTPPLECAASGAREFASARLVWEYWTGGAWLPLDPVQDETLALTRSGHVRLKLPSEGAMHSAAIGAVSDLHFWIRVRPERAAYERTPRLLAIRANTVSATQAESVRDEVLGGSDGSRTQVFRLANAPVLEGTLELVVDEGSGEEPWTQVEDFYGSGPDNAHYTLNRTTGEIRFGDGERGRVPVANVENRDANVVARAYRFGGGARGNVVAGTITTLITSIAGVDDTGVGNLLPAHDGREEEGLEEAKLRAPRSVRSRSRAVTAEDFEYLAAQAGAVRRAKALPLHHPGFPGVPIPGVVTVIVVPDGDAANPAPSEGTLRTVCAYLDRVRLLTTEVHVVGPTYREVSVTAEVVARPDADPAEVKQEIERSLGEYFHPLRGGEDGRGWPFGGDIFYSRAYQRVFGVQGVERIARLVLALDGEEQPECRDIPICDGDLLYSTEHTVRVSFAFDE